MARFRRESTLEAPLASVWAFHSTIDGLQALTPDLAGLRIEALRIPETVEGEGTDGDILVEGSEMELSVGPIPGGPRKRFTSVIVERSEKADEAYFVDEMRDGPMQTWRHTHRFLETKIGTRLVDDISYETGWGSPIDGLFRIGLTIAFWDRHRRTREILGGS